MAGRITLGRKSKKWGRERVQALLFETLKATPILSGAFFLAIDRDDPRHELLLIVGGLIIILLALTSFGIDSGHVGQTIISAFMIIVGYWFGQKEQEKKKGCN